MTVTGCNYGVHDFVLAEDNLPYWMTRNGMHMHRCSLCDASYIRPGEDGCSECRPSEVAA